MYPLILLVKAGRGAYVSLDPTKIKVAKEKHIFGS